jgi:hypothetical protein
MLALLIRAALCRSVVTDSRGGNFCALRSAWRGPGRWARESLRLLVLGSLALSLGKIANGVLFRARECGINFLNSQSGYLRDDGERLMLECLINHCSIISDLKRH